MPDLDRIERFRELNTPLSTSDLLLASQGLLSTPYLEHGRADGAFLQKNNMFLGEPIFSYWRKEFTAIIEHIGSKGSYSAQRDACLDQMMREIEWRTLQNVLVNSRETATPEMMRAMVSGVEWFSDDTSYDYVMDTRKWVSKLTVSALEVFTRDIFIMDFQTVARLQCYEKYHRDMLEKKLQQLEIRFPPRLEKKAETLMQNYQWQLDEMRGGVAGGDIDGSESGLTRLSQQWTRLIDALQKQDAFEAA